MNPETIPLLSDLPAADVQALLEALRRRRDVIELRGSPDDCGGPPRKNKTMHDLARPKPGVD